ncbi:MAG: hypothetical protein RJR37_01420 [Peptococcaceae bacterium MAG4]|nr:hypothetical protein [Peptococcaceae bacterium MAG4]
MKKTIYIFSSGELSRKDNTIYFENDEGRRFYSGGRHRRNNLVFGELDFNKKIAIRISFFSKRDYVAFF